MLWEGEGGGGGSNLEWTTLAVLKIHVSFLRHISSISREKDG